jgi:hypothetical protein
MVRRSRTFVLIGAPILLVLGLCGGGGAAAQADPELPGAGVFDGTPTQAWADLSSADPLNSSGSGGWADMSGGVAGRPYVTDLTVVNGATQTPVITGATSTVPPSVAPGGVTAVVSPVNLCGHGQTPSPGSCYATPNRVALNVVYGAGDNNGYNFASPSETVSPPISESSIIDMTVALNTLGRSLRWTWINGDLLYWKATNLGQQDATVRIKFRPASMPYLSTWPSGAGCTATPIFNCNIARSDAEVLSASLLFSLDNTLDPALTGAVFATQNAISGYLSPQPGALALDLQAGSTHTRSDGSLQRGTVEAFLPAGALQNLYGLLPGDAAAAFAVTRSGDPGTNNAPTYQPWNVAANGSEGLLITVTGVTFSVPKYRVKARLTAVTTQGVAKGVTTTVTAAVPACTAKAPCLATVFDLGKASAPRYAAVRTAVITNKTVSAKALKLSAKSAQLRKGDRYLLVVRSAKTKQAITSTLGTVR